MAQLVKVVAKPFDLSLITGIYMVEEEKQLPQVLL